MSANGDKAIRDGHNVANVHERLRRDILSGEIPAGETSQLALARELEVGRTPLREALRMLQHEGLVISEPNRRVRVAELSAADVEQLYSMRIALEAMAVQVTVPELGTIHALQRPYVILTSNRTRELHDALKRRCLYHWIGHPSLEREIEIVGLRVPGVPERLAEQAARFAAELRSLDLQKPPGIAETIDWVRALTALGQQELDVENVQATLGSLLKYHEDLLALRDDALASLVASSRD